MLLECPLLQVNLNEVNKRVRNFNDLVKKFKMSHVKQKLAKIPWEPFSKRLLPLRFVKPERKRRPVLPMKEWPVVYGDKVQIMSGRDRGKQGTVCFVSRSKNHVYVKGLNTHQRYLKPEGDFPGGFIPSEAPLHVTQIKLVDPSNGFPTEVVMRYNAEGQRVRVNKENGRIIPKPPFERRDFKSKSAVEDSVHDTDASEVSKVTYTPSLLFFHEEIMKELGISPTVPKSHPERRDMIYLELKNSQKTDNSEKLTPIEKSQQSVSWMQMIKQRLNSNSK